jgi:hypothetical protein
METGALQLGTTAAARWANNNINKYTLPSIMDGLTVKASYTSRSIC